MSCAPGKTYGMSVFGAGDCKPLTDSGVFNDGQNVLLKWGQQVRVINHSDTLVMACLHQTLTTTVTMGPSNNGGWNAGDVTFDSASSSSGQGECITLGRGFEYVKISKARWRNTSTPTYRPGRCTAVGDRAVLGGPCLIDADCGTGGTCSLTSANDGVYISICPAGTDPIVQVNVCGQ